MPTVFIDTNVLVYAAIEAMRERAKWQTAVQIVTEVDFALSAQVMAEFTSVVRRKAEPPIGEDAIEAWLSRLSRRNPAPVDASLVMRGRALSAQHGLNYFDGAILAAAERLGCDTVLSEDMTDGQSYGSVTVRNPFRES